MNEHYYEFLGIQLSSLLLAALKHCRTFTKDNTH